MLSTRTTFVASYCKWLMFGHVVNAPEGLLFCNQKREVLFWLPERVLAPESLRERVLAILNRADVPVYHYTAATRDFPQNRRTQAASKERTG